MTWYINYYVEVESDLISAKKWYKEQQAGLQLRFVKEVRNTINMVEENPLHYQIKYRNIRVAYLNVFPFGVHFYISESNNTITIIGVLHQHRDPQVFFNR